MKLSAENQIGGTIKAVKPSAATIHVTVGWRWAITPPRQVRPAGQVRRL
jgi:hypothetical protein